jgi:hypothetical protein
MLESAELLLTGIAIGTIAAALFVWHLVSSIDRRLFVAGIAFCADGEHGNKDIESHCHVMLAFKDSDRTKIVRVRMHPQMVRIVRSAFEKSGISPEHLEIP